MNKYHYNHIIPEVPPVHTLLKNVDNFSRDYRTLRIWSHKYRLKKDIEINVASLTTRALNYGNQ